MTFITIGHSDRDLEEFSALLAGAHIVLVVDVRKLAGSRKFPQFNRDSLAASLGESGIEYEHIDELTGRRPKSHTVPPETNALWRNQSFHNYADFALSTEFAAGLARLRALAKAHGDAGAASTTGNVAIMCAEAVWWRCHRRIIADHLLAHGENVAHVISSATPQPATLTPGAQVERSPEALVVYPAPR